MRYLPVLRHRALLIAVSCSILSLSATASAQSSQTAAMAQSANVAQQQQGQAESVPASIVNPAAASVAVATRGVALSRRVQRDSVAPVLRQEDSNRTNTALMVVGAAAVLVGAAVGDDAGTILIIGGAGIGLFGLYRFLN